MNATVENLDWVDLRLREIYGEPERRQEPDPLDLMVRTILSQNTSDVNSRRAHQSLRKKFPTWNAVLNTSEEQVAEAIRSGGLANQKSRRIIRLLTWVSERSEDFDISWICEADPEEMLEEFTAIKGIGVKTVAIVLCFACDRDIFPVDTHVNRVCRRLGFVAEKSSPTRTFREMDGVIPQGRSQPIHLNMIRHGRTLCKSRNPRCDQCPLIGRCLYGQQQFNGNES